MANRFKKITLVLVVTLGLFGLGPKIIQLFVPADVEAQIGPTPGDKPTITAVNIVSISATSAALSFSYVSNLTDLRYQVAYGQSASYSSLVPLKSLASANGNDSVDLLNLDPSATYHFSIQMYQAGSADQLTASADRTFTTANANSGNTPLVIGSIRADCVDSSCTVYFMTNKLAKVEARWDLASQLNFTDYATGTAENTDSSILRSLRIPLSGQTSFTANTKYHYRLQATGAGSASFTTGDLTLTTSSSPVDHVFATGSCSSGGATVDIGSCLGTQLCSSAGQLINDCVKCGFACAATQTCRTGTLNGQCPDDPTLNGAPSQCNESACYNTAGQLVNPAPAKCYASWPRCNANTILKVRNDRGCNLWLSCATSFQTDAANNTPSENICLSLGACNSLNTAGQCNHYLPLGQCNNDPVRFCNTDTDCQAGGACNNPDPNVPTRALKDMTFQAPADVAKIADLSGNVVAGLDWGQQGGANVIQGQLPWQLMRQIGGDAQIKNGDLEYQAPLVDPWNPVPAGVTPASALRVEFEDRDNGPNHILTVEPITQTTTGVVLFSGAATNAFNAAPSEYYYAEARIKAEGGSPVVRMQFGYGSYTTFAVKDTVSTCTNDPTKTCTSNSDCSGGTTINLCQSGVPVTTNTYVDVPTTSAWQRVTLGPLKGMSGQTKLAFVCADQASCGKFSIDDVVVKPILQINTNPNYLTPSCRLYPKNDSPSCDYADPNGVIYKGWKGYCLERDSQTGTCLSWWPVDIIKGESNIFNAEKSVGYQDRAPLFLCAQTAGQTNTGSAPYTTEMTTHYDATVCSGGNEVQCADAGFACNAGATGICIKSTGGVAAEGITSVDANILESDLASIYLPVQPGVNGSLFGDNGWPSPIITADSIIPNLHAQKTCGKYPNQKWTACFDGTGSGTYADYFEIWFEFDPVDHHLKNIHWTFDDQTGDAGGTYYRVFFNFKDRCDKIVQVVTSSGDAKVFASRVGSASYKVPDLQYGLNTDLRPFGGILQPDTGNDPATWSTLYAEQPNYDISPVSGQVRSGSPYTCNGPCGNVICTRDNSTCLTNGSVDSTKVKACQKIDTNGFTGECIGVPSAVASNQGQQTFTDNATCLPVAGGGTSCGGLLFAQDHIKRLFTESFGVWSDLQCDAGNAATKGQVCLLNSDCGGNGLCSVTAAKYAKVPNSEPDTTSAFVGWKPPATICAVNPAFKSNACSSTLQACTASLAVTGMATGAESSAATKQAAMVSALGQCGLTAPTGTISTTPGVAITSINPGNQACNGVTPECPGATSAYQAGTTASFTTFTLTAPCSFANGQYSCAGRCSSIQTYMNTAQPTAAPQAKYLRPPFVSGSNADYCAIPPAVSNVKFTSGDARKATISGGSGNVGIKFNTNADVEQVPLGQIKIDWGDSQDSFAYPFAPRNDPAKPHVFAHTYVANRGDQTHCTTVNGRSTCAYHIKIQVSDNWGWCNDGNSTTPCHPNKNDWVDSGLTVIVQP